jgi:hypothetical protein
MARTCDHELLSVPPPPVHGRVGLAQGAYGDNGNLELVAPGVDAGLWVMWFNADTIEHYQGAAVGRWSGGVRFGRDWTFSSARITQMHAGPRFLEVLSVGAPVGRTAVSDLLRWWWTPADGFLGPQLLLSGVRASSALVELRGRSVHALAVGSQSRVVHLWAALDGYPRLSWRSQDGPGVVDANFVHLTSTPAGIRAVVVADDGATSVWALGDSGWQRLADSPQDWRIALLCGRSVFGVDTSGRPRWTVMGDERWSSPQRIWSADALKEGWDDLDVVATSLGGGRLDVVGRRSRALWHGHIDITRSELGDARSVAPQPISSTRWTPDPAARVHRP